MKIKSLTFHNHPILGNLSLDFCNSEGNPIDTIILAGENGTGKTTILNTLFCLLDVAALPINVKKGLLFPGTSIRIQTTPAIIKALLGRYFLPEIQYTDTIQIGICDTKQGDDLWKNIEISLFDIKGHELLYKGHPSSITGEPIVQSLSGIYNDVQINFTPKTIQHTTATELDCDYTLKRSSENMATEIAQLFVDIQSADSQDLANWVMEHPGEVPPECMKQIRIKRFNDAFSTIFDDLQFYKIDNRDGHLDVCFRNHQAIVRIGQLSSGEKQIVFRGGFILKDSQLDKNPITLIDEPEISLHPNWQIKILDYYKRLLTNSNGEQFSQIFVVTHSPFIIHNDRRANDKVLVLSRNKEGRIYIQDKPEYYICTSLCVVEDAFLVDLGTQPVPYPFVFLEGETDEIYMKKAIELFGIKSPVTISWVGAYINKTPQNAGSSALNHAFTFLCTNPSVCSQGAVFLFDFDTNHKPEDIGNLHARSMPEKYNTIGFNKGIENLLVLPIDFDKTPYIKQSTHVDSYGVASIRCELDKVRLCKHICDELSEEEQRQILIHLKENISIIEAALFD